MLIWMCALHCEAKPLVDFYRLQKSTDGGEFDIYSNTDTSCIVSGIGPLKMAAATAWAAEYYRQHPDPYWINLGIAGHAKLAVGSTILASKVSSHEAPSEYHPHSAINHDLRMNEIISFSTEQSHYPETAVCDMEAHAFIQSASQFSPLLNCQCIKVISDNTDSHARRDKAWISDLIAANMQAISQFARKVYPAIEQAK